MGVCVCLVYTLFHVFFYQCIQCHLRSPLIWALIHFHFERSTVQLMMEKLIQ